jgi:hypothetical protein
MAQQGQPADQKRKIIIFSGTNPLITSLPCPTPIKNKSSNPTQFYLIKDPSQDQY